MTTSSAVRQIIRHAESRMQDGEFSSQDIDLIKSVAYPDAIDELLAPKAKSGTWQAAYQEALPVVESKWAEHQSAAD